MTKSWIEQHMFTKSWNEECPPGTPVRYWPNRIGGEGYVSRTCSLAWRLDDGTPVVTIEGRDGGIGLDHVQPIEPEWGAMLEADRSLIGIPYRVDPTVPTDGGGRDC